MKFEKAFYITHTQCCTLAPYLSMNVNVRAKENEKWKSDTAHALDSEMKNKSTSLHRESMKISSVLVRFVRIPFQFVKSPRTVRNARARRDRTANSPERKKNSGRRRPHKANECSVVVK